MIRKENIKEDGDLKICSVTPDIQDFDVNIKAWKPDCMKNQEIHWCLERSYSKKGQQF